MRGESDREQEKLKSEEAGELGATAEAVFCRAKLARSRWSAAWRSRSSCRATRNISTFDSVRSFSEQGAHSSGVV